MTATDTEAMELWHSVARFIPRRNCAWTRWKQRRFILLPKPSRRPPMLSEAMKLFPGLRTTLSHYRGKWND